MNKIKHFMLPEHMNRLYTHEAGSSMTLTREVADKINELIDAYNQFSHDDLTWKQEQDGRVRKAVLYMKDNLLNSLNDLMVLLRDSGFIDDRIEYHCDDLKQRIDNLLGCVVVGTSTMDAEIIDMRLGGDGKTHKNGGLALRDQNRLAVSLVNSNVYCGYNNTFTYEQSENGAMKINLKTLSLINSNTGVLTSPLNLAAITTNIDGIVVDGENYIIHLPQFSSLVYNTITNTLEIRQSTKLTNGDIVALTNLYSQLVGGSLWNEYNWKNNKTIETKFSNVDNVFKNEWHSINGTAYIGTGGKLTFTPVSGGGLSVHFTSPPIILTSDANGKGLSWDTCTANISTYFKRDDQGTGATITIPFRANLIYRPSNEQLAVCPVSMNPKDSIVLINNLYSMGVSGCLIDEQNYKDIVALETGINVLRSLFNDVSGSGRPDNKVELFSGYLNDTNNVESFLFFTDPHIVTTNKEEWEDIFHSYMSELKRTTIHAPVDYVISGGDWLNDSNSKTEACYSLSFIDRYMKNNFKNYHGIIGNHDTNYQGDGKLTVNTLKNVMFREHRKTYYKFNGVNTDFYLFDSDTDWDNTMTSYRNEQCEYFANELLTNTSDHIAIITHIIVDNGDVVNFANELSKIASAFNNRTSIAVNGKPFDFSSCRGKVEFMLGGHNHQDVNGVVNNIPYLTTKDFSNYRTGKATFDLILVDYDHRLIKTVRIGNGSDRTIELAEV